MLNIVQDLGAAPAPRRCDVPDSGRATPPRRSLQPGRRSPRCPRAHAEEGTQRFLALPFLPELVRIRTRFIDDFVRDGLAAVPRQIVLLGAGFDPRALRLPEVS